MPDQYVRIRDADDLSYHHPQHVYESVAPCPLYSDEERTVTCQVTSNVRESVIWCEECRSNYEWSQLKKCWQAMGTRFATVWQDTDTPNLTTGRVETDPKKFAQHLREQSEIAAERLQMPVDYQPCDPADTFHSDEGLGATHDRAVADGRKDSRGRFVWPV